MTEPRCPRGCSAAVTLADGPRWGRFWRCSECGHEWTPRRGEQLTPIDAGGDSIRTLRARMGALRKWAATDDRTAATRPARTAFMRRFEAEVDPDGRLEPGERAKRAEFARRAHMTRLAMRSVAARRRRAQSRRQEDPAA
jgi:hypothetical protein